MTDTSSACYRINTINNPWNNPRNPWIRYVLLSMFFLFSIVHCSLNTNNSGTNHTHSISSVTELDDASKRSAFHGFISRIEQSVSQQRFYMNQHAQFGYFPHFTDEQPLSKQETNSGYVVGYDANQRIRFIKEMIEGRLTFFSLLSYSDSGEIHWDLYDQAGTLSQQIDYVLNEEQRIIEQLETELDENQEPKHRLAYRFAYHPDGASEMVALKDGNRFSKKKYDAEGRLIYDETYDAQGNRSIYQTEYYPNGNRKSDQVYLNDVLISSTLYYEQGAPVSQESYETPGHMEAGMPKVSEFFTQEGELEMRIEYNPDGSVKSTEKGTAG